MDDTTKEWLDERFGRVFDRLDALAAQQKSALQKIAEHETRLVKLERMSWLVAGIGALLSPVVVWAIIEIAKAL